MPINVNCQHFKYGGHCTHHAAPRQWFGLPQCVLMHPPSDVRLRGCALVYPHERPDGYPLPPPIRLQTLGSQREFTEKPMNSTREVELHDGKVPRRRMVIASNCETLNLPLREPGGFGEVVYWASGCRTEDGVEIWTPGGHAPETKQEMNEVWVIAIRQNKTYGHGDFGTSWELQTTGPYNSGPPHPAFPSEEAAHAYIRQQPHAYLHMLPLRMELRAERPSD